MAATVCHDGVKHYSETVDLTVPSSACVTGVYEECPRSGVCLSWIKQRTLGHVVLMLCYKLPHHSLNYTFQVAEPHNGLMVETIYLTEIGGLVPLAPGTSHRASELLFCTSGASCQCDPASPSPTSEGGFTLLSAVCESRVFKTFLQPEGRSTSAAPICQ